MGESNKVNNKRNVELEETGTMVKSLHKTTYHQKLLEILFESCIFIRYYFVF